MNKNKFKKIIKYIKNNKNNICLLNHNKKIKNINKKNKKL